MTFAVDVDGVAADLLPRWIELYNQGYDDDLTCAEITAWETHKFVKPECGIRIYHYLDRSDLYDGVLPIEGALDGVRELRDMGRVVFVTSCTGSAMAKAKIDWMFRHGFLDEPKKLGMADVVITSDKSLVRADLMIDDYGKNLFDFGGMGILYDAPYNQHVKGFPRAEGWEDVLVVAEALVKVPAL